MDNIIYIGGPLHGQDSPMKEDSESIGALDQSQWYERRTLDFVLEGGRTATRDFLVAENLTDAQAVELAQAFVLAGIAAQQPE